MKRRVVRLVLLLVLGAIVNICVAWGFAIRPRSYANHSIRVSQANPQTTSHYRPFGEMRIIQHSGTVTAYWIPMPTLVSDDEFQSLVPTWSAFKNANPIASYPPAKGTTEWTTYSENSFGWPLLSLRHAANTRAPFQLIQGYHDVSDAIELPTAIADWLEQFNCRSRLPVRPLPGFAVNTLLYTGLIWLMFFAPFALRRRLRIKRSLCPVCAYPRGESGVCTECGRTLC